MLFAAPSTNPTLNSANLQNSAHDRLLTVRFGAATASYKEKVYSLLLNLQKEYAVDQQPRRHAHCELSSQFLLRFIRFGTAKYNIMGMFRLCALHIDMA